MDLVVNHRFSLLSRPFDGIPSFQLKYQKIGHFQPISFLLEGWCAAESEPSVPPGLPRHQVQGTEEDADHGTQEGV